MPKKNLLQLSGKDLKQLEHLGIQRSNLEWQYSTLRNPPPKLKIERPCTVGDGIVAIPKEKEEKLLEFANAAIRAGELLDFIPASGAATRMFADLIAALKHPEWLSSSESLEKLAQSDDASQKKTANALIAFFNNLEKFAFFKELSKAVSKATGGKVDLTRIETISGYFKDNLACLIIELLLNAEGLGYAQKPKALLLFHDYPSGARTALEEHLVNASRTTRDQNNICRIHFTISPEHEAAARALLEEALPAIERDAGCRFEVGFSFQDPSTDTIALDANGNILRNDANELVFRAGGHGSLLQNLEKLKGSLIYLNNIDNVQPESGKAESEHSKRLMVGLLLETRKQVCEALEKLGSNNDKAAADKIRNELLPKLNIILSEDKWLGLNVAGKIALLRRLLDRPIRVCGMVKNEGEAGGGPFWVRTEEGLVAPQIVEQAELNMNDPEQRQIFSNSTHFNPVRIVCSLKNCKGRPYDLLNFVNNKAVFTSTKEVGGQKVQILERPGLWNGSMADWISLFVEVDLKTFTPVKTVLDLMRPAHQAG